MKEQEIWKDVVGYEGLYQVSDFGRVKSIPRCGAKGGNKKLLLDKYGYYKVHLCKNGNKKKHFVHRLVGQAFIPNPLDLPQINHKDENSLNNHANNLEWCTPQYNHDYGNHNARTAKSKSKTVYQYTIDNKLIRKFESAKEAEKINGFTNSAICNCCKGRSKTHKGFKWSYKLL